MKTLKAFPNRYPYNELLFSGVLSAKTRNWRWNHSGLVLLYTSSRSDKTVAIAHDMPTKHQKSVIVGAGLLKPVVSMTTKERKRIEKEFGNGKFIGIGAGLYRYEFTNLVRFDEPIDFKPPRGVISVFNVPYNLVKKELDKHKTALGL